MFFQIFTNGTLIDASLSRELAHLGNVVPIISLEGFEEETDSWRGKGAFQKIMGAMDNLRKDGVPFGCSIVVTKFNIDAILSDEFNDMLVEKGCLQGWQFLYMPVGKPPSLELMPTPEQRLRMKRRGAEYIRSHKKIFMVDNHDVIYFNGDIAGGRHFFHINSRGDVEPCVFIHFAVDNVHHKSLPEILESSFFTAFRSRQPCGKNLLRSCFILDHPEVLQEIVNEFRPYPTHPGAEMLVNELHQPLIQYAQEAAKLMDPVWEEEYQGNKCNLISLLERSGKLYQRE
jgi:MoaA/NifB/PqqE/SkfB family radical SAM enzyme